jgi:hypothetical protein
MQAKLATSEYHRKIAEAIIDDDMVEARSLLRSLQHEYELSWNNVQGRLNGAVGKIVREKAAQLANDSDTKRLGELMLARLHELMPRHRRAPRR